MNYKNAFDEIIDYYALLEKLVEAVNDPDVEHKDLAMDYIAEIVENVGDGADVLAEAFCYITHTAEAQAAGSYDASIIEEAFRSILSALETGRSRALEASRRCGKGFKTAVMPAIRNIRMHTLKIAAIFMRFVDIRVNSFMKVTEINEMKKHEDMIAGLLYQQANIAAKASSLLTR